MAVTVEIFHTTATIHGYRWTCADPTFEALLNSMLHPLGPSGADPDPDRTAAQAAIDEWGGQIISADELPYDPNVIY